MTDIFDIDIQRVLDLLKFNPEAPMIFSSGTFLWLFLFFSAIYLLLSKRDTARIIFVTLFSYYFYYKSSGLYFALLAFVTTSDYFIAKALAKNRSRWLVALSVTIDLALLGYFKYTNFFGEIVFADWKHLDIILPVGISFFTFQSLSYTIDVYRGNIKPLDRFLDYAFYVSFFPQLVAGPIVRARDFIPQIRRPLIVTNEMFGRGLYFIIIGLFKKAIISDYISLNFVDRVFDAPTLYSGVENLLAVYGYTLQIYCDFSGYSDMAIGIALILGFEFPMNFNNPYRSRSITEFWRRWHISLSSWLKDYLYISLGGNRKGKFRQYINLLITMLLGGFWHGANLRFILWGGLHGLFLCLDKIWNSIAPKLSPLKFIPKKDGSRADNSFGNICLSLLSLLVTFHLVAATWILFRASSYESAVDMVCQIFNSFQPNIFLQWVDSYWAVGLLMIIGYTLHFMPQVIFDFTRKCIIKSPLVLQIFYLAAVVFLVIQIKSSEVQPFIYFDF